MKIKHPEQAKDEIYLGNATREEIQKSSWRTSRLGLHPIGVNGEPIHNSFYEAGFRPWFIARFEVEQAIKTEELLNQSSSAGKIKVYEDMLESM